jgi:hypothetical protein
MKYSIYLIIISFLATMLDSCVERIDIELDDSYIRLVVDGTLTTDTMSHTVSLSTTTSYYYNQPAPPVSGALVHITDGHTVFSLEEDSPGIYRTDSAVYGVPGETYTLNIRLVSAIGGYTEYSAASTLYPVSPLDSVSLEFHSDWSPEGVWEVKCYVLDPISEDFYRFMISKNGTMLTDTLDEWFVTDDRFFNGNYAYGAPVAYLPQDEKDDILKSGDTITVEINNIGDEYAAFIWDAQSEVMGSYPLFSGPPANVKGNINNGASGFFAAYSASRSFAIVPDSIKEALSLHYR